MRCAGFQGICHSRKSSMSAALAIVAHKKNFNLDPDASCEYQQRTTARLRRACRHTSQALRKKPRAVWVKEIFGEMNISSPAGEYDEQNEHDEHDSVDFGTAGNSNSTVFVCGVDGGTKLVTRKVVGRHKHAVETTFDLITQVSDDTLGAWARWSTDRNCRVTF